jgi:hypothetical protein
VYVSEVLSTHNCEVKKVSCSPYFPGNPYLEKGVAWNRSHPCMGSISFLIDMKNGSTQVISPILFKDENPTKSLYHYGGLEHWNLECWQYLMGEEPKIVKKIPGTTLHQLGKTDWIELEAITNGTSVKNHIWCSEFK